MAFVPVNGSTPRSGGFVVVPDSLRFADSIARDAYFAANPAALYSDLYCTVAAALQRYNGSVWESVSAVLKGDGAVPAPYDMRLGANGKLQLFKNNVMIQEQDETGAWITSSVSTGTGSLHIGDLHSNGSAGENVVWVNTDSHLAWYPSWAAVSIDGNNVIEPSVRIHGNSLNVSEPVGAASTTASMDYVFTLTAPADLVFFYLDVVPAENYTGRCRWYCEKAGGVEVASFFFDATAVTDTPMKVPFRYPLWVTAGQSFDIRIEKADGALLRVRPSASQPAQPYRKTYSRPFTDYTVFHAGNIASVASSLASLTGDDRLQASALRDYPAATDASFGMVKVGNTLTIDGSGVLNSAVSPTGIKIIANQAARLALPLSSGALLAIQQDNGFTYGIEANQNPSVLANWKQIGTVATNVVSFKGRNGAVSPTDGDYTQAQIDTVHDSTGVKGRFGIDSTGIYWEPKL